MEKGLNIHQGLGTFPCKVKKAYYTADTLTEEVEVILNHQEDFNTLLREIGQYNNDYRNKEEGKSLKLIN